MNNLVDYVPLLHKLWSGIKNNLKYLAIPIMYLAIIVSVVPSPKTIVNIIDDKRLSSYNTIILDKNTKINYILNKYNLSKSEFSILCGIVLSEADDTYEDAYAVINTIYNRTHSKNWVRSVDNKFGKGKGMNLYYQAISPNQFTVYASGTYKRHINEVDSAGYDAIVDFLYTENIMHNYLSFRSHSIKVNNSESFSKKGNNYFNTIKEENRI